AVATVSSSGLITAVAEGAAQIVVTSEGKTASALVTVTPVPVASISITPNQASLRVSQRVALTAQAFDAQGRPLANRRFTWLTGAPSVATVNQQGEVTAVGLGTASVFAATEGISAGATITVTNIPVSSVQVTPSALSLQQGGSAPLLAVTRDSAGSALSGRVVTWSSSNEAVAVVSSLGRVTAVAAGSAVITATSEGVSGTCNVTVSNVPVASVTVTPANPTLGVGQALGMTATMRDGGGTILSGRPVTWASSNTAVATITAAGLVTAVASGTTTISAVSEGVTGMTLLTVSAVPVARVEVLPTTVSLNPNQTSQLTATAYDANNNVLVRPITWTSNATGVATVSGSGLVTAVATGSATISATSGGVTGTAIVTVTLVPVASVTVTPSAPNMFPGNTLQLAATARDAGGNIITGRPTSWLSSNTAVATVSSAGLVTAVTQGAATITATIDGVSGNATVTINQTRVASVTLTPTSSAIYQGQQVSFTAVARDSAGNVLARPITWTSTNVTIVGVNDNGLATGVNPGTATVIATVVGGGAGGTNVADSSGVSVALVPVASMTISPKPVSIFVSQQQQLTVQLLDSAGGTLSASGRTITWGSLNPAVASVNASGLVSGLAQGSTRVGVSTPGSSGTVTDSVNVTVNTSPIASVTVQPKPNSVYQGQTKSLRAVIVDGFGTVVRGRNVSWQSRNTGVVTVSQVAATPDSATFTGVAAGTTYIVAIDPSGLRDSTQVTASLVPVASVQVTPSAQSLQLPDSVTLAAQPKDSAGGNLTRTITWVSLNPSIASVASTGQMTGKVNTLSSGSATIQARANGAGAGGTDVVTTAAITVTAVVHTVQLTAPRNFIVKNDTMHSSVVLRDTLNNVLTGKPITYSSLPSNVASVAANGVVTGGPVLGSVTITATSEGKSGSVAVSGIGGIASITSACTSASCASTSDTTLTLSPANSQTYTITVRDSAGGALSGRTLTVTTGSSAVASLSVTSVVTNGSGQATVDVTPMSAGSTTITFFAQPREGAIPPGTPGSNNPTKAITIVVQ
ncbi:MAG: beta strand repeat-containing protein, partial [Gemmatimonadaceae bacterium]